MNPAPIALFCYNRPWHLEQTVNSLRANDPAGHSELYIFSDAARDSSAQAGVEQVRSYLPSIQGFKSVNIVKSPANRGVAASIIDGVTRVCGQHGRVIVVEDDLVLSPYFLKYMNDALEFYADEPRVISINGYMFPVQGVLPETFFIRGTECWGWATWRRGWELFDPDGTKLLAQMTAKDLTGKFDLDGTFDYTSMLRDQVAGRNDSWAIRWHASAFLANKLTLYPGRSLVANIGNDGTGRHSAATAVYDTQICDRPILVGKIPVEQNRVARAAMAAFFRSSRPTFMHRVCNRLRNYLLRAK